MFFIIIIWGAQSSKVKAAFYLLLYTTIFSIPLLLSILFIYVSVKSVNIYVLTFNVVFSDSSQK